MLLVFELGVVTGAPIVAAATIIVVRRARREPAPVVPEPRFTIRPPSNQTVRFPRVLP